MERIKEWRKQALSLTRDDFCFERPHPVLLLRWVVEGDLARRGGSQSTHLHNIRGSLKDRLTAGGQDPERRPVGQERLIAIRRAPGGGHQGLYLVGRTRDSDVCINDYTVSAAHGRIHFNTRIERWMYEDTTSTNGSWLNGVKVPPNEKTLLDSLDELQLGRLVFLFFSAADLHRYLTDDY